MRGRKIVVVLTTILAQRLLVPGERINEQCYVRNKTQITCSCVGNEEFLIPDEYNYENISSFFLSSCSSAVVHFSSLAEAKHIEDIVVRNISDSLTLRPFVTSKSVRRIELLNAGRIPVITHDTFATIRYIELFRIEDTTIGHFEEQFTDKNVTNFILANVTIERTKGLYLFERGRTLRITDCNVRNVETTLNLAYFSDIEILDSTFELMKPGQVSIEGDSVLVRNSVFVNVSMNLVALTKITVNDTCADGKSSLRLLSGNIESFGNKLPTEIIYTKSKDRSRHRSAVLSIQNNTVCIAGNCKCFKSDAPGSRQTLLETLLVSLLATLVLPTNLKHPNV